VVRSLAFAQAKERALRRRLAKAVVAVEGLNHRGRGKKRFREEAELRAACEKIVGTYQVEGLMVLTFATHTTEKPQRRDGSRPAGVKVEREVRVTARIDEEALAQTNPVPGLARLCDQSA
jgi:transposase